MSNQIGFWDIMYAFRKIALSDMAQIRKLRNSKENRLTATAFESLYSWREYFGFSVYTEPDFALVYSSLLDGYMYPFGDAAKSDEFIRAAAKEKKKFVFLSEEQAKLLEAQGFSISESRDSDEYVYESHALALRSGEISANLKRKCKTFLKNHSVDVIPIDESNLSDAAALMRSLGSERGDREAAEALLNGFLTLRPKGILLKTESGSAMIMGYENTADIFTMTVVVYDSALGNDAVPICINKLAELVCDEFDYIDLEEDMGIEGLRTMKQLYKPKFMLRSYTGTVL